MHIIWALLLSIQVFAGSKGPSLSEFQSEAFWGEVKSKREVSAAVSRFFKSVGHTLSENEFNQAVSDLQAFEQQSRQLVKPSTVNVRYEHLSGDPSIGPTHYRVFMPSPFIRKNNHLSNNIHMEYYRANMVDESVDMWPPWKRQYHESRPLLVLYPHSSRDHSDLPLFAKIVRELLNYHVIIVSYPHFGLRYDSEKSNYKAPIEDAHPDFFEFNSLVFYENMKQTVADLQLVHQWLMKLPEVDNDNIHFVGFSLGSAIGSVYQGIIEAQHTKSFTFIAGGGDWGGTYDNLMKHPKWSKTIVGKILKDMNLTKEDHRKKLLFSEAAIWSQFIHGTNVRTINAEMEDVFADMGSLLFRDSLRERNDYDENWYSYTHNPDGLGFWDKFTDILLPFLHNLVRD